MVSSARLVDVGDGGATAVADARGRLQETLHRLLERQALRVVAGPGSAPRAPAAAPARRRRGSAAPSSAPAAATLPATSDSGRDPSPAAAVGRRRPRPRSSQPLAAASSVSPSRTAPAPETNGLSRVDGGRRHVGERRPRRGTSGRRLDTMLRGWPPRPGDPQRRAFQPEVDACVSTLAPLSTPPSPRRSCSQPARRRSFPEPCSARSSTTRASRSPGVKITVTNPESPSFKQEETTDDRGRYTIFVANALPAYTIAMSKEGFQ